MDNLPVQKVVQHQHHPNQDTRKTSFTTVKEKGKQSFPWNVQCHENPNHWDGKARGSVTRFFVMNRTHLGPWLTGYNGFVNNFVFAEMIAKQVTPRCNFSNLKTRTSLQKLNYLQNCFRTDEMKKKWKNTRSSNEFYK